MAHPVRGETPADTDANIARAMRWYEYLVKHFEEHAFVADWILMCMVLDEHTPGHRERGMRANLAIVERCDEIWLCGGRFSPGMQQEVEHAGPNVIVRAFECADEPPRAHAEPTVIRAITYVRGA